MSSESTTSFAESATETFETFTEYATATANATGNETTTENITKSISLATPLLYLGVLIFTLITFSIYHRRTKVHQLQKLTSSSLFNPEYEIKAEDVLSANIDTPTIDSIPALIYSDLKELNAHEKMLKTSLVQRAAESMRRIIKLKETEPSIMILYTKGLIGDDSFKRYQMQVKLQDAEMMEIAKEAENYKQGWSRTIFPIAQEVMMNQALRRRINSINERKKIMENLTYKGVENVMDDIKARIDSIKINIVKK